MLGFAYACTLGGLCAAWRLAGCFLAGSCWGLDGMLCWPCAWCLWCKMICWDALLGCFVGRVLVLLGCLRVLDLGARAASAACKLDIGSECEQQSESESVSEFGMWI